MTPSCRVSYPSTWLSMSATRQGRAMPQELLITEDGAWWSLDLYCRLGAIGPLIVRLAGDDLVTAGTLALQVTARIGTRRAWLALV